MGRTPPDPKQQVSSVMYNLIAKNGFDAAKTHYQEISESDSDRYDLSESQLNILGYYYLNNDRIETAIEVFKLNAEAFPESANVYDSLGEAYLESERFELSKKSYQKVLKLNPNHSNAKSMIEILNSKTD